jgi:DNA-directed RNA polymerase specialized sigma24 family protein
MNKREPSTSLSRSALDQLLNQLHSDRNRAAERYVRLREKLSNYFAWERCPFPTAHADDVMDRVARRITEGEPILNIDAYAAGVARLVAREAKKAAIRAEEQIRLLPTIQTQVEDEEALRCLETCLEELPPETRAFILDYYAGDGSERIANRRKLAEELGTGLNALRNRALRLRANLQECVRLRLEGKRDKEPGSATEKQKDAAGTEGLL